MTYISAILALIQLLLSQTAGMTFEQGLDKYLDLLVGWQWVTLWVMAAVFVIAVVAIVVLFTKGRRMGALLGAYCSIWLVVLGIFLPLLHLLNLWIATGLASAVNQTGIIDPVRFWGFVALLAMLGVG